MAGRERWRVLVVVACLVALGGMMVHYAAAAPDRQPTGRELATDYGAHVGEPVTFWMTVVAVHEGGFAVDGGGGLTVVGSDAAVEPGDVVAVHGTLRPRRRVAAERVLVSPAENRLYMFGVSVAAVALAVGAFLRRWRLDRRRLAFVPRTRTTDRDGGGGAPAGGGPGDEGGGSGR